MTGPTCRLRDVGRALPILLVLVAAGCDGLPTGARSDNSLPAGYHVIPVDWPADPGAYPVAFNDSRQLAVVRGDRRLFGLVEDGRWLDQIQIWSVSVTGLNNHGVIVGYTGDWPYAYFGAQERRPFVAQGGRAWYLGAAGLETAVALDVNDSGTVVGAAGEMPHIRPFVWDRSGVQFIDVPGGAPAEAVAVSESGRVALRTHLNECVDGRCRSVRNAYVWDEGSSIRIVPPPWRKSGWTVSQDGPEPQTHPRDMNDREVVGSFEYWVCDSASSCRNWYRAFLWRDGRMLDLGTIDEDKTSSAVAINQQGRVLITLWQIQEPTRPVLWYGGKTLDLNDAVAGTGWEILNVLDLNNRDEILAYARREGSSMAQYVILEPDR